MHACQFGEHTMVIYLDNMVLNSQHTILLHCVNLAQVTTCFFTNNCKAVDDEIQKVVII